MQYTPEGTPISPERIAERAAREANAPKVVECHFVAEKWEPTIIHVTMSDGQVGTIGQFYPDELSFSPNEFIGLTTAQVKRRLFDADVAYIQS